MTVRAIVLYPSPWLRACCAPVDWATDPVQDWVADLCDTLASCPGVGIAAPQIGVLKRLFVIDERRFREPPPGAAMRVYVNPRIEKALGHTTAREGCLSVPGFLGETARARRIILTATDAAGNPCSQDARGFLAIALQHELDHLNGILFLDRLAHRRAALRLRPLAS